MCIYIKRHMHTDCDSNPFTFRLLVQIKPLDCYCYWRKELKIRKSTLNVSACCCCLYTNERDVIQSRACAVAVYIVFKRSINLMEFRRYTIDWYVVVIAILSTAAANTTSVAAAVISTIVRNNFNLSRCI